MELDATSSSFVSCGPNPSTQHSSTGTRKSRPPSTHATNSMHVRLRSTLSLGTCNACSNCDFREVSEISRFSSSLSSNCILLRASDFLSSIPADQIVGRRERSVK